jgi:hypothetical protein
MTNRKLKTLCALFSASVLSGCLYSTQHLHTGLLMPAGKTQATLAAGRQPLWKCSRSEADSLSPKIACDENGDGGEKISQSGIFKGSVDYRLGVRDSWGPFPGVEMEWHFEVPTNPATMEFALNLAVPSPSRAFHHKIGAGWGVGAWADDSFFAEYAASIGLGTHLCFGNLRATYLATQIGDVLGEDFAKPFPSNQHWVFQSAAGILYRLPDWIIVPDFIIPQINLTLPTVPAGEQKFRPADIPLFQWDATFGFGWEF